MLHQLEDIIINRRSIRKFNNKPVDMGIVQEIIRIASHAPSNSNRQGWKFYAIRDKQTIGNIHIEVDRKLKSIKERSGVMDDVLTTYAANFMIFREAPILLICCFVKPPIFSTKIFPLDEENSHLSGELISLSLVMQNILLMAESRGLGTLIMTAPLIAAKEIKEILSIPRKLTIGAIICMGYYDEKPQPPAHYSVDKIFEER